METETKPNLVFANLETGTTDDAVDGAYVIDCKTLADDDRRTLDLADEWANYNDHAAEVVRRVGVSVADLWAAYKREQRIVAVLGGVYDTDDDGDVILWTVDGAAVTA